MGFDEEWGRLRAEAAERSAGMATQAAVVMPDAVDPQQAARDRLAEFRSRVVLLPLDERGGLWTATFGGLDWICAFSGEDTLARFAEARGEARQEWTYHRIVGARLLDDLVPALEFPCGVAWDAAGPEGIVFPPLRGFVPDGAALDDEVTV
ncbi:hypothetical protein ACFXKW_33375 [Streptomyces sp. NPDC059193]|uniref:hypothetical protein n=1 Tax=Streptomyces sp. NPDC059193 TaxID=3346763 RepID=UPI0036A37E2C